MNKKEEINKKKNNYITPDIPELNEYMEEKKDKDKNIKFTDKYYCPDISFD